jgi:hypothetical protein
VAFSTKPGIRVVMCEVDDLAAAIDDVLAESFAGF